MLLLLWSGIPSVPSWWCLRPAGLQGDLTDLGVEGSHNALYGCVTRFVAFFGCGAKYRELRLDDFHALFYLALCNDFVASTFKLRT